jgi:hypothetical protein
LGDVSQLLSAQWRLLDNSEREKYEALATADRERAARLLKEEEVVAVAVVEGEGSEGDKIVKKTKEEEKEKKKNTVAKRKPKPDVVKASPLFRNKKENKKSKSRAPSAFRLFAAAGAREAAAEAAGTRAVGPVSKKLSAMWAELGEEGKAEFADQARALVTRPDET